MWLIPRRILLSRNGFRVGEGRQFVSIEAMDPSRRQGWIGVNAQPDRPPIIGVLPHYGPGLAFVWRAEDADSGAGREGAHA